MYFLCNLPLLNITSARTYHRANCCWFSRGKMDHFLLNFLSSTTLFLIPTPHHRGCLPTAPVVEINMIPCYPKVLMSTSASASEFFTLVNCVRGWAGHSECLVLYSELTRHLTLSVNALSSTVSWHANTQSHGICSFPKHFLSIHSACTHVCVHVFVLSSHTDWVELWGWSVTVWVYQLLFSLLVIIGSTIIPSQDSFPNIPSNR